MCRVADRWGAAPCLNLCFSTLVQLLGVKNLLGTQTLAEVMSELPDSISSLGEHRAWVTKLDSAFVNLFVDVHALLTSPEQLQLFRGLPFHAVRAWAASDELTVDSENSVAVALTVWAEGEQGSKCTEAQKKELSGLLRVRHLSTGAWHKRGYHGSQLHVAAVALTTATRYKHGSQ
jgi:hypothetical protein